ncbi:MAG: tetratricopeptide repeat protein [candidate division Zixibacteria bacterium]|nr:tetratricopeptide repeat protein [candidate division Zixibacteria bacterium]
MARKSILIIFIALIIFSVIYALWGDREVTTSSDQAYQAYKIGEATNKKLYYNDAIPHFERAISIDTNFAMAYGALSTLYFETGRKEEAKRMIDKAASKFALITEREQILITIGKANIYEKREAVEEAINEYIAKFPDDGWGLRFVAEKEQKARNLDKAISAYEKIIDMDPGDALAYNMLGYLSYYNGNFDEAISFINKYSMIASNEANPHDSYGEILMNMGRYDEAIKEFEKAIKIKPNLDFVLMHLAQAYRFIGQYRDAIGYYESAKDNARSEGMARELEREIALTHFLAGQPDKAIEYTDKLLEVETNPLYTCCLQSYIAADIGMLDKVEYNLSILDSILVDAKESDKSEDYMKGMVFQVDLVKAKLALENGKFNEAITGFSELVEESDLPGKVMLKFLLGEAFYKAGRLDDAENTLLDNLQDNPNHPYSLFALSQLYRDAGKIEKQKQALLTYLSVMSGADDSVEDVHTARVQLDSLAIL